MNRKQQLSSLYGKLVETYNQQPTTAMCICALYAREVGGCAACLHYKECMKARRPLSRLGQFIAVANIETRPIIRRYLHDFFIFRDEEIDLLFKGSKQAEDYAVLKMSYYKDGDRSHAATRTTYISLNGKESLYAIKTAAFNAFEPLYTGNDLYKGRKTKNED